MKFSIDKNAFLSKLTVAQKAMAAKSNMPALTGILISVAKGELVFVASNMDISIKTLTKHPSLKIESEGVCLVPGKLFTDIIRKLGGDTVNIELEDDNVLRIMAGSSDITLNLLDVADYPKPQFDFSEHPIVLKAADLKDIIKETTFASSSVENKPILTGVNIRIYDNKLLAVSTDSFRLSKRNMTLADNYLETNVIIPSRSLNELSRIIEDSIDKVEIYLDKNKVLFKFDDIIFQSRLLEGNYPDTSKLIPTNFPVILKFNKDSLIEAIDRVSTLSSNPNATSIVKLQIEANGTINLISNSPELGTIKDTVSPVEVVTMNEIKISFSSTFFLDALKAFSSPEVFVKFTGEIRPFIFEADNDPGLVELVLPMKSE